MAVEFFKQKRINGLKIYKHIYNIMTEQMDTERACSYADYTDKDLSAYGFEFYINSSKFSKCKLPEKIEKVKFEFCSFDDSDLRYIKFIECEFNDCTFDRTDLRHGRIKSSSFTRCDFEKTDFRSCELLDVSFIEPTYKQTDFRNCSFSSIGFSEEEAKECDLRDIIILS